MTPNFAEIAITKGYFQVWAQLPPHAGILANGNWVKAHSDAAHTAACHPNSQLASVVRIHQGHRAHRQKRLCQAMASYNCKIQI